MAGRGTRATMKDVAALAGVSAKTVSNVVTGTTFVRPETVERVEAAMRELDFVPNLSARGLRNGRSGTIAVALPDLATAFSADLLHSIVEVAHERGFAVQIEETGAEPGREYELLSRARAHLVDGVILNPIRLEDSAVEHADRLPPVVLIGEVEQHVTDRVLVDSRAAAASITRHVIERGARRVAAVGGDGRADIATATSRLRLAGYRDALREAGLDVVPALEVNHFPWSAAAGASAVDELIARATPFDAVVAFTDSIAVGALHALHAQGVRVPEDVLVTGFDDVEIARFATPALTTVRFDRRAFASEALTLLESRIDARTTPPRAVTVPYEVVVRASTGGV
ncbi:LacI family DNA-binding transcriptional regulator [Microbacterium betulae]|uniref:LacI family DNA-binding transcriptional regulator n=1 Tax=Microbacterium betulae TaxID=2981139 RepID=A0AA97I6I3_9MICO|nr:LacI family DNA-binding transcriptional regulator [Microbacterium sp. AB]WOF22652.1 LacI family DNA-binding transcriptional regulator [Microbacterium sp. AB]